MSFSIKGKVILAAGLVLVVAAGIGLYFVLRPALQVGSFAVSKSEYKTLVAQAKDEKLDEGKAKEVIIDDYKLREAAKQTGIKYTLDEAKNLAADYYQKPATELNDWQVLYGKRVAIKNLVNFKKEGGVRGAIFNYPFTRNFAFGTEGAGPDFGKKSAIEADKAYALQQAQADRKQLVEGKTTAEALIGKLTKDQRLIYGGVSNGSMRIAYTNGGKWQTFRDGEDAVSKPYLDSIKALGKGITEISAEKVTAGYSMIKGYDTDGTEVAYKFYKIDEISVADGGFAATFDNLVKTVKVVSHV